MRNPDYMSVTLLPVPRLHVECAALDGPAISVSGRQILLATLRI
jgi:hypothetical protein